MFFYTRSKKQYSGQVLAVVLVVIVVGVIIALALMSRTMGNNRRVQEERDSADSAQIADTALDSVKDILLTDLVAWTSDPNSPCGAQTADNLVRRTYAATATQPCELNGLAEFNQFTDHFQLNEFYNSIRDSLLTQCGYVDEASTVDGFKIVFTGIGDNDPIEIEKDDVFAFIPGGSTQPATCQMRLDATAIEADTTGVVFIPLYVTLDGNGEINNYKPHRYDDIVGVCIGNNADRSACSDADFVGWEAQYGPDYTYITPMSKTETGTSTTYYMYEMRIRPVGGDITVTRSYVGSGCSVVEGVLLRVSAIVNCNGNSRGREFILSEEEWAPAIFDYVLFNGQGTLENR